MKTIFLKQIKKIYGFVKINFIILIAIITIIIILAGLIGGISCSKRKEVITQPSPTEEEEVTTEQPPATETTISPTPVEAAFTKNLISLEDIILEKIDFTPKIPEYNLPLKTEDISNYQEFSGKIQISSKAQTILKNNGFVAISTPKDIAESGVYLLDSSREAFPKDDFAAYYQVIKDKDLPIFITTDSLLHYYHIFFDTTLMKLERDLFYSDIWELSEELLNKSISQYNEANGDLKEAARRNITYLSVALELLRPKENQIMSDETLKEEYCTSEIPADFCEEMIKQMKDQYGENISFKYFSETDFRKYSLDIPDFVKSEVNKEIELIEKHEGWEYSPIFIYKEDYSQYVPRGHYTKSEKLKNYFKALMWYGRMTSLIKGSPELSKGESLCTINGIISEYDSKIQTLQAGLITKNFLESQNIQQKWQRIYSITSFFVGFSDDLGPYEYSNALKSLFEEKITLQEFEEKYPDIRDILLDLPYNPKIYSGLGECKLLMPCPPLSDEEIQELKVQAKKLLEKTKGFRLMGQRFTLDSYLFSEIVSPYSGECTGPEILLPTEEKPFTFTWDDNYPEFRENRPFTWVKTDVETCPSPASREVRGFPRGLDIMALLGSDRAKEILESLGDTKYSDYEKKFSELKVEVDSLSTEEWFKNLYLNWLYVLKSLLVEFGEGYQTFMQTEPWQDKELNTALASWTELRHDTILYVKQSYTMAERGNGEMPPIVGYVEPVPEFYARLLTLTEITNKGLKRLLPPKEFARLKIGNSLNRFSDIINRLLEISKKELENKPLTKDEYDFIKNFGEISEGLISYIAGGDDFPPIVNPDIFKTTLVADVHTDGNTKKVLEEGVGYIKTLVVAYKLPEGHILVGVGPIFSYYEFKQPMDNRLTDEAWREMLDKKAPLEPEWIKTFSE